MASSQKVKTGTEQQVELLIELKEKVDLFYKQLNQFRGACRSVDRLNRAVRRTGGQLNPDRMLAEFVKFERDYRVSRKRLRKLDRKLLSFNLYDKLYDLYESLVMGESIGTGGDLIDSFAIDKVIKGTTIVVDCHEPVKIENTSVDDFAGISIDHDTPIDLEMDLMEDACLEPRQSATLNNSLNKSSTDLSQSTLILVADVNAGTHVTRQQTRRIVCMDSSAIVVGCNGPVEIEDNSGIDIASTERHFQCLQCDKSFKTSSILSSHKRIHTSEPQFKCSWEGCDFCTNNKRYLKKHMSVHSDERPFQCPHCDKSFKTSSYLSIHKRTHESEHRFKCNWEGCDFGSYYSQSLKAHQTVHTGERPFQCPHCDKSFKTSSHLSIHKRTHESEPRFKCSWEGCDFVTYYSPSLKDHQTVHTGDRSFQCPQCDKSFKTSSVLWNHKQTHESEPRFKCSWEGCDYDSNKLGQLTKHQNRHMKPKLKA